jgi:hypothetical protein
MDIIKDPTTRTIAFTQNGATVQTLQESVTANLNRNRNGIVLEDITGRKIEIYTKQIDETQLLPNPPIKFQPGTTVDLWDLLFDPSATPFFDELHIKFGSGGGGNTVDETNVKIIATPTYTVLATDYILWVTVNCTITLPLIPTVAIAFPIRIFCRNVKVTVQRTAPDLINGAVNFKMKKYDQATLRAGQANDWGIGD